MVSTNLQLTCYIEGGGGRKDRLMSSLEEGGETFNSNFLLEQNGFRKKIFSFSGATP